MFKSFILSCNVLLIVVPFSYIQDTGLNSLYKLSDSKTRLISPENFTGEKGKGGMATLDEGSAAKAARKLGQGWKVNPFIHKQLGETFTLGEINGSGVISFPKFPAKENLVIKMKDK